eukprot:m.151306 g.151306  ORF g.151306 m.151306 type:complete len:175 (-) comp10152_c0_seq9:1899-2423(-)
MCFAAPWPPASTWPALTTSCPSRQPMTAKSCCAITASTSRNQALTCPSLTLDLFQARRALRSILAHVLFVLQLVEIGPSAQLTIRRIKHAPAELEKQALKVPRALKPKKKKNVSYTEMGDKMGRIHMQSQDLAQLQTRKMKGLKRSRAAKGDDAADSQKRARLSDDDDDSMGDA